MSAPLITLEDVAAESRLRRLLNPRRTKAWGNALLRNPPVDGIDTYSFFMDVTSGCRFHEVREALLTLKPWSPMIQDDIPKRQSWRAVSGAVRSGTRVGHRKTRSIHHDTRIDHARQLALLDVLQPVIDRKLTCVAVAYVDGRVMDDVIVDTLNTIRERSLVCTSTLDIGSCFDQIDWRILDQSIDRHLGGVIAPEVLALVKSSYRVPVVRRDGSQVGRTKGIPQGAVLAPVLLNLYLADFDQIVQRRIGAHGGFLRRFSDDMLLGDPGVAAHAASTSIVVEELSRVKLTIKPETEKVADLRNPQNPAKWLGYAFTMRRTWVPRERIETKAAELLDGLFYSGVGVEQVEERLDALMTTYTRVLHIEDAERAVKAISTLLGPFLARAPENRGGIENVRRQIEKRSPLRWSKSAPGVGQQNVEITLRALPSASDMAFGLRLGRMGKLSKGSVLSGGDDGRQAGLHAGGGTPTGGSQTIGWVDSLSGAHGIEEGVCSVGRFSEVTSGDTIDIPPLAVLTTNEVEEALTLGNRTAHSLEEYDGAATVRVTVVASAVEDGEVALEWPDASRSVVPFRAAQSYSKEEVVLHGYTLALHRAAERGAKRVELVVQQKTIHGTLWRGYRIRSPFVMRKWGDLLSAAKAMPGCYVTFTHRSGKSAALDR